MKIFFISAIVLYQRLISPWLGNHCRFYPSCSEYSRQAIKEYGALTGLWFMAKRFFSCHPFNPGGYEPLKPVNG